MIATVIHVPSDGAWFEGHFPGRPILPGVAEIALAVDTLAPAAHPLSLQGIAFARLRELVFPGDRLELAAREQQAGRLRIDLKRDGVLVANGELIVGAPDVLPRQPVAAAFAAGPANDIPDLDDLLPHRAPMRFLTAILQETTDSLTCSARIPARCALVRGGQAPAVAAIEAAAQAAAAWEGLRRWRGAGVASPRIGYLVALREITFHTGSVPAERDLMVSVRLDAAAPPLTHYRIEVSLDGTLVTQGTIATFLAT